MLCWLHEMKRSLLEVPKGSNVVPFGVVPKQKRSHNQEGTPLEPLGKAVEPELKEIERSAQDSAIHVQVGEQPKPGLQLAQSMSWLCTLGPNQVSYAIIV